MKTNANVNSVSAKTKQAIETYLYLTNHFRNSYFWSPPSNAAGRRSYEEKYSFSYSCDGIDIDFNVSCSCRNIYVSRNVSVNGKKTNATGLKKFLN